MRRCRGGRPRWGAWTPPAHRLMASDRSAVPSLRRHRRGVAVVANAGAVRGSRMTQERWRALSEWPLTVCALLFLVAYAWTVIADLQGAAAEAAEWTMWSIWLVFVVDYGVSLALAPRRWHWFFTHLLQFLVVVLPLLRPLRLLRLVTLWGVLQRATGQVVRGRVTVYVAGSAP